MNLTNFITKLQHKPTSTSCFKGFLTASFILTLTFMSGCGGNDDYELYSTIKGYVSDYETGVPIDGATVTLSPSGLTSMTDGAGNFTFSNLDSRQYTLTVQKTGYQPNRKEVHAISGEEVNVVISLTKIPK